MKQGNWIEPTPPAEAQVADIAGETVWLLPERCLYWPRSEALMVADLHLGKEQVFQQAGMGVPAQATESDLARLSEQLSLTGAKCLWVLGDFIHHRSGLTDKVRASIVQWVRSHPGLEIRLVVGNHDRASHGLLRQIEGLQLIEHADPIAPFALVHEFEPSLLDKRHFFAISGHWHPVVKVFEQTLPVFYVGKHHLVLPAFSLFTNGVRVCPASSEQLFAIADQQIVQVK